MTNTIDDTILRITDEEIRLQAILKVTKNGISVSVNSNLALATPEKIKRLKQFG